MSTEPHRPKPTKEERASFLGISRSELVGGETRNASPKAEAQALAYATAAARSLKDDKCEEVLVLDLRGKSQVTDYFVIASGTSTVQMRAAGHNAAALAKEHGLQVMRDNLGESEADWIVVDATDVVVHVFEPDTRVYYDLEMLWGDAERIDWGRPDGSDGDTTGTGATSRNRAGLRPDEELG